MRKWNDKPLCKSYRNTNTNVKKFWLKLFCNNRINKKVNSRQHLDTDIFHIRRSHISTDAIRQTNFPVALANMVTSVLYENIFIPNTAIRLMSYKHIPI